VRDIVIKALFVYPSQKRRIVIMREMSNHIHNQLCQEGWSPLVRCEGDFSPCEEEWCTLSL
jgi:hypothetical protein